MNFPIPRPGAIASRFAAALLLAVLLGGCVGTQELIKANQKLSTSAADAKTYAEKLKTAVDAQDSNLAAARTSVTNLAATASQLARDKAVSAVDAAYYKAAGDLNQAYAGLLTKWLETTQTTFADFDAALKKAFGPIEQARSDTLVRYQEAKRLSEEYPNDSARRGNMDKQLTGYLTASAVAFQQEDQARASATDAWQKTDRDFRAQIDAALAAKKGDLDRVHSDALTKIATSAQKTVDIGPEAAKLSANLDPLVSFCDGAQKAADANLQYFRVYGFGKGSLFGDFVKNLGTGFINALPLIGNGKTVTPADVTAAVDQVVTDQKAVIAAAGSEAAATLKQTGESLMQQATTAFTNKLQAMVAKIVQTGAPPVAPGTANAPSPAAPAQTPAPKP